MRGRGLCIATVQRSQLTCPVPLRSPSSACILCAPTTWSLPGMHHPGRCGPNCTMLITAASRMQVIVVEDENGNVVRETMKDTGAAGTGQEGNCLARVLSTPAVWFWRNVQPGVGSCLVRTEPCVGCPDRRGHWHAAFGEVVAVSCCPLLAAGMQRCPVAMRLPRLMPSLSPRCYTITHVSTHAPPPRCTTRPQMFWRGTRRCTRRWCTCPIWTTTTPSTRCWTSCACRQAQGMVGMGKAGP